MKSFNYGDRVVAISGTPDRDGLAKGDKGTVVGTSPIAELAKKGVYVHFDLDSPGHRGNGRWFANFNQLELLPSDSNLPGSAQENMQQKLDEICTRLEKIENLMVITSTKEKMQESKEPWYPHEEKFGPWVETYGNPIPDVPDGHRVQLLTRWQRINKCGPMHIMLRQTVREDHEKGLRLFPDFVAYRIVL